MPKRSTELQRLVYIIQTHVARDAEVIESALLADTRTGDEREVDVLIRTTVAGVACNIGVEVQQRSRPADVQWIDQVQGKFAGLPIHMVVLVAQAGFTKAALARAALANYHTFRPGQPTGEVGRQLKDHLAHVRATLVMAKSQRIEVTLDGVGEVPSGVVQLPPDVLIFDELGSQLGWLYQLVEITMGTPNFREVISSAGPEHTWFSAGIDLTKGLGIDDGSQPVMLYAQKHDEPGGPILQQILSLEAIGPISRADEPLQLEFGELLGREYARGVIETSAGKLSVVLTQDGPGATTGMVTTELSLPPSVVDQ